MEARATTGAPRQAAGATTFRAASRILDDEPAVKELMVAPQFGELDDFVDGGDGIRVATAAESAAAAAAAGGHSNGRDAFRAFVSSLEANGTVEMVSIRGYDFRRRTVSSWDGTIDVDELHRSRTVSSHVRPREADVDRLFQHVMPRHRSLTCVHMSGCIVPPETFQAFLLALHHRTRIQHVLMLDCPLTAQDIRAVAGMLRRNALMKSVGLHSWSVRTFGSGDDRTDVDQEGESTSVVDACRVLCDACARSGSMDRLTLSDNSVIVDRGAVAGALGPDSTLACLRIHGAWTAAGGADLVFQLRTNERLETCDVSTTSAAAPGFPYDSVEELLRTFNCTLRTLYVDSLTRPALADRIRHLLRRNHGVRNARGHLEKRNYAVGPVAAWPRALEAVGRFPTLVYRFVRRGNLPVLSAHLLVATEGANRGRRRQRHP
jgi:hypothetical protein